MEEERVAVVVYSEWKSRFAVIGFFFSTLVLSGFLTSLWFFLYPASPFDFLLLTRNLL